MPITKEFQICFAEFVTAYKKKPAGIFWAAKEDDISKMLDDKLTLITQQGEYFHDSSIIDHLNRIILSVAKENNFLLSCWVDFFIKFNKATEKSTLNTGQNILVLPEGKPSESYINELEEGLSLKQQAFDSAQKSYAAEIGLLKKQVEEHKKQSTYLNAENKRLNEELKNHQSFEALGSKIVTAQSQLVGLNELLKNLEQLTTKKPSLSEPANASAILQKTEKTDLTINTKPPATAQIPSPSPQPLALELVISETVTPIPPPQPPVKVSAPKAATLRLFGKTFNQELSDVISQRAKQYEGRQPQAEEEMNSVLQKKS